MLSLGCPAEEGEEGQDEPEGSGTPRELGSQNQLSGTRWGLKRSESL